MSYISDWINEVHQGDAREKLREMPADSVDLVITSPPYYGKRNYGEKGQIGLEESPKEFVKNLIDVTDEIYRVLKDSGTFYLNIGDTYAGGGGISGVPEDWDSISTQDRDKYPDSVPARDVDFPDKCKMLIPHRIAISMIDQGWICRNDNIWFKDGSAMPESVEDRRTTSFEYVFHFVKNQDYYYDQDKAKTETGANQLDVIQANTASFPKSHFAVFPTDLIKPLIESSCPEDGVVLDPFIGSGTTAIAAEQLDRDWIGIDLNKDYVDMSYKRIDDETKYINDDRSVFDY